MEKKEMRKWEMGPRIREGSVMHLKSPDTLGIFILGGAAGCFALVFRWVLANMSPGSQGFKVQGSAWSGPFQHPAERHRYFLVTLTSPDGAM